MLGSDVPAPVSMAGAHLTGQAGSSGRITVRSSRDLDAYLDEFVFRFNRRTSGSRGMLFYRLLQQAVVTAPVTYDSVVKPRPKPTKQG